MIDLNGTQNRDQTAYMIGVWMSGDDTVKMRYANGMEVSNDCRPLLLFTAIYEQRFVMRELQKDSVALTYIDSFIVRFAPVGWGAAGCSMEGIRVLLEPDGDVLAAHPAVTSIAAMMLTINTQAIPLSALNYNAPHFTFLSSPV
jgi:hypothetical protein